MVPFVVWLLLILDGGHLVAVDEVGRDVCWVSGSGPGRKRIRLIRKTQACIINQ